MVRITHLEPNEEKLEVPFPYEASRVRCDTSWNCLGWGIGAFQGSAGGRPQTRSLKSDRLGEHGIQLERLTLLHNASLILILLPLAKSPSNDVLPLERRYRNGSSHQRRRRRNRRPRPLPIRPPPREGQTAPTASRHQHQRMGPPKRPCTFAW